MIISKSITKSRLSRFLTFSFIIFALAFALIGSLKIDEPDIEYWSIKGENNKTAIWVLDLKIETRGDYNPKPYATNTWSAPSDGNWSLGTNWSLGHKPATGEDVVFDSTSTYNCTIDENTNSLESFTMATGYTGTVSLGSYTLNVDNTADTSYLTGTQGTLNLGSGLVKIEGNWNTISTSFTLQRGSSTVQFTGTGTVQTRDLNHGLNHVTIDLGTTRTAVTGQECELNGVITVNGTIAGFYWRHKGTSTDPIIWGASGIIGSSFGYEGGTQNNWNLPAPSSGSYWRLSIQMGNDYTATLTGNVTVTNSMSVSRSGYFSASGYTALDLNGYSVTSPNLTIGSSGRQSILYGDSSTVDINGNLTINDTTSYTDLETSIWTVSGNWTSQSTSASNDGGTSTVTFDGSTQSITTATTTREDFHHVKIGNGSTVSLSSNLKISGNFGDGSDNGTYQPQSYTMYVAGNWDSSSSNLTFTKGTSTIDLTGTGNLEVRDYTTNAFNNLNVADSGNTTTLIIGMNTGVYGTLTIGTGTFTSTGNVYLYHLTNPLVNNGIIDLNVVYSSATSNFNVVGTTYQKSVYVYPSSNQTGTLTDNLTCDKLHIYAGTSSQVALLDTNNKSINATTWIYLGLASDFYGAIQSGSSTINVKDVYVTNTGSYLDFGTSTWTVSGNFQNASTSASWNAGGTITFNGNTTQTLSGSGTKNIFNVVQFSGTGQKNFNSSFTTSNVTALNDISWQIKTTTTWTINASSTISANSGFTLTIDTDISGTQSTTIAGSGVDAIRVDVKDNDNSGGIEIDATVDCTDSGNNLNWNFGIAPPVPPQPFGMDSTWLLFIMALLYLIMFCIGLALKSTGFIFISGVFGTISSLILFRIQSNPIEGIAGLLILGSSLMVIGMSIVYTVFGEVSS